MLKLSIETDNDAFAGADGPQELARILRALADKVDTTYLSAPDSGLLRDVNGNGVGRWSWDI